MAPHPCCGNSLQTGTKIVSIVQIVCAVLVIVAGLLMLFGGAALAANADKIANSTSSATKDDDRFFESGDKKIKDEDAVKFIGAGIVVGGIFFLIIGIFSLILGVILLKGSKERNLRKCQIWLIIECILIAVAIVKLIVGLVMGTGAAEGGSILGIILGLYFIWIVWAFVEELKREAAGGNRGADGGNPIVFNKA